MSFSIMTLSPDSAAAAPRGVRPGSSAPARAASAVRCSSIGVSFSSPERWTSIAWIIASSPSRGSALPSFP